MDIKPLNDLLEKQIDRREFLAYMGAVILGVVGVSGLLRLLANPFHQNNTKNGVSYGQSRYGGS